MAVSITAFSVSHAYSLVLLSHLFLSLLLPFVTSLLTSSLQKTQNFSSDRPQPYLPSTLPNVMVLPAVLHFPSWFSSSANGKWGGRGVTAPQDPFTITLGLRVLGPAFLPPAPVRAKCKGSVPEASGDTLNQSRGKGRRDTVL